MEKKTKDKWVAALRSKKYSQGRAKLRTPMKNGPDKFCCLGVLCDVLSPGEWGRRQADWVTWKGSIWQLPLELREEFGIPTSKQNQLIELNDDHKASFNDIADWIEENL